MENNVKDENLKMEWYVVSSFNGHEDKVCGDLTNKLSDPSQFEGLFEAAFTGTYYETEMVTLKSGKIKEKKTKINLFPSYIFIRCIMTDDVWYAIRNTPGCTGIIGSHGGGAKPTTIPDEDMIRIFKTTHHEELLPANYMEVFSGARVEIIDGPFKGMCGTVQQVDSKNKNVKLSLDMMKDASITVSMLQIELLK